MYCVCYLLVCMLQGKYHVRTVRLHDRTLLNRECKSLQASAIWGKFNYA